MSSLIDVVNILTNVINIDPNCPQRSRREIEDYLVACPSHQELSQWHKGKMELVSREDGHELPLPLAELCGRVAAFLVLAAQDVEQLRSRLLLPQPEDPDYDRHLLNQALGCAIRAFEEFKIVSRTPELSAWDTMDVILDYLEQVYNLAIPLASVIGPLGTEETFLYWREEVAVTGLRGFRFDGMEEIKRTRVADPHLSGVISPTNAVPLCYLPAHPEPPVVYRNPFPNPPRILRNLSCW